MLSKLIFSKENDKIKITSYKNEDGTFNVTSVKKINKTSAPNS